MYMYYFLPPLLLRDISNVTFALMLHVANVMASLRNPETTSLSWILLTAKLVTLLVCTDISLQSNSLISLIVVMSDGIVNVIVCVVSLVAAALIAISSREITTNIEKSLTSPYNSTNADSDNNSIHSHSHSTVKYIYDK